MYKEEPFEKRDHRIRVAFGEGETKEFGGREIPLYF